MELHKWHGPREKVGTIENHQFLKEKLQDFISLVSGENENSHYVI